MRSGKAVFSGRAGRKGDMRKVENMEAVYEWIQQIAVFAVISFLVLYLMDGQEKKNVFHFYLSLLLLFLVLRPVAALFQWDRGWEQKLTELVEQMDFSVDAVSEQVLQIRNEQDQQVIAEASAEIISWLQELVKEEDLELLDANVVFDEERLEQKGELQVNEVWLEVRTLQMRKSAKRGTWDFSVLKTRIGQELGIEESAVSVMKIEGETETEAAESREKAAI